MTMNPETSQPGQGEARRSAPQMHAWLVQDREGQPSTWIELTGLWRTRTGTGFSGSIRKPVTLPGGHLTGRMVILPAHITPGATTHGEG